MPNFEIPISGPILPAIVSTSTRMHGEYLRLLFLQAHRETEAHFTAAGISSQTNNSEALRFKRAAFYNGLNSKVGLASGCQSGSVEDQPQCPGMWHSSNPGQCTLPLALPFCSPSFFHTIYLSPAFTSA